MRLGKFSTRPFSRAFNSQDAGDIPRYLAAVVGGVFLGGIALALLNRKTIQELRERIERAPGSAPDDIY